MVVLYDLLTVILICVIGAAICWQWEDLRAVAGFAIGGGIVGGASLLSWVCDALIQRYLHKFQKYVLPGTYLLKILLLLAVLPMIKSWGYPSLNFLLIGFVIAILGTLIVTSVVILKAEGPDFDFVAK